MEWKRCEHHEVPPDAGLVLGHSDGGVQYLDMTDDPPPDTTGGAAKTTTTTSTKTSTTTKTS